MWGALSEERMGLSFKIAAGPASAVILGYCLRFQTPPPMTHWATVIYIYIYIYI
jgi:hypothetical protein